MHIGKFTELKVINKIRFYDTTLEGIGKVNGIGDEVYFNNVMYDIVTYNSDHPKPITDDSLIAVHVGVYEIYLFPEHMLNILKDYIQNPSDKIIAEKANELRKSHRYNAQYKIGYYITE